MPECRVETYVRLARELTIPICSPEIIEGRLYSRADWLRREASDITRTDTIRGGITGAMKMALICQAIGIPSDLNLTRHPHHYVLGPTSYTTSYYTHPAL